jgi:hypothetical protein
MKPFVYDAEADIEERSQLYLGVDEGTGLYTRGVLNWFHNNEGWFKAKQPSDAEIRANLLDFYGRRKPWTNDPNQADCWSGFWIDRFQKHLPNIDWRRAIISAVPLDLK